MSQSRIAAVQVGFLLVALWAGAVEKNNTIRITVLDSESRSITLSDDGVPKNCDAVNFDAYCHNSRTAVVTHTLLVKEGDDPPFRITCTVDTKWSRCVPLQKGQSFDARRDKRGLIVFYADDYGKLRKQLYTLVDADVARSAPVPATKAAPASPAPAAPAPASSTPRPDAAEKREDPAPAANVNVSEAREGVKCSFTSTPAGAEVSVDGRYVGSTPSVLTLSVGNHAVEVSLPGFAPWKRDLTVSTGSELTVNAVLQKVQ
jgi:PEGA domain-containing protein